jgi:hypothetical protein
MVGRFGNCSVPHDTRSDVSHVHPTIVDVGPASAQSSHIADPVRSGEQSTCHGRFWRDDVRTPGEDAGNARALAALAR